MTVGPPDPGPDKMTSQARSLAAGLLAHFEGNRQMAILLLMQTKAILEDARIINENLDPLL